MRTKEMAALYATLCPRGRGVLLVCEQGAPDPDRQGLFPTLGAAMRAAGPLLDDPRSVAVWLYDGRRLYDRAAITRYLADWP
jgi:hypothetical protein